MNRTSKTPKIIVSLVWLIIWLVWLIWVTITGKKGFLGDLPYGFILWGFSLFVYIPQHDILLKSTSLTEVSLFSKKEFMFKDIEITSIEIGRGSYFIVNTTIKRFCFAYTKANYAALKEMLPRVKYSAITVEELDKMVKKNFFTPS